MAFQSDGGGDPIEIIYTEAREALTRQLDRFDAIEQKVGRHFTVLAVLLGTFAISLPVALQTWRAGEGVIPCLFLISYLGMLATAFGGVGFLTRALRYEVLWADPLKKDFVDEYGVMSRNEVLTALAKGAVSSYYKNLDASRRKERWAARGYKALQATLILAGTTLVLYLCVAIPGTG